MTLQSNFTRSPKMCISISPLASDQGFGVGALGNAKPDRYFAPAVLDRTHQLLWGYADLPYGFQPDRTFLEPPFNFLGGG